MARCLPSTVRHLRGLLPLLTVAAAPLAPPGAAAAEKVKVGFVTNNPEAFWDVVERGARDAADKFGVEVVFRKPARGEAALQRDIVNDLVADGARGVAVSVIDPDGQAPDLREVARRTNLITVDNDAPESNRRCFIGTDNYKAGTALGKLLKEALPDGGTVAVFTGIATARSSRLRVQGVMDELAGEKDARGPKLGKYALYRNEPITDGVRREAAVDNAKDALTKLAEEKHICLVGVWAYHPVALLEAVKAGKLEGKVKVLGFDEYPDALAGVAKGEIYGTVVQDPYRHGYLAVETLARLAKAGKEKVKIEPVIEVPVRVVTTAGGKDRLTVQQFEDDLKDKMKKDK